MALNTSGFQVRAMPQYRALDPRMFVDASQVGNRTPALNAWDNFLKARQLGQQNAYRQSMAEVQKQQEQRLAEQEKRMQERAAREKKQWERLQKVGTEGYDIREVGPGLTQMWDLATDSPIGQPSQGNPVPFSEGLNRVTDPENPENFMYVDPVTGETYDRSKLEPAEEFTNVDMSDLEPYRMGNSDGFRIPVGPGKFDIFVDTNPDDDKITLAKPETRQTITSKSTKTGNYTGLPGSGQADNKAGSQQAGDIILDTSGASPDVAERAQRLYQAFKSADSDVVKQTYLRALRALEGVSVDGVGAPSDDGAANQGQSQSTETSQRVQPRPVIKF